MFVAFVWVGDRDIHLLIYTDTWALHKRFPSRPSRDPPDAHQGTFPFGETEVLNVLDHSSSSSNWMTL